MHLIAFSLYRVLSCQQYPVGSNGTIEMSYSAGGKAAIFTVNDDLKNSGLCGNSAPSTTGEGLASQKSGGLKGPKFTPATFVLTLILIWGLMSRV